MIDLPRGSAIPPVADAIVALCQTIPGASVFDGPKEEWPLADVIGIGYGPEAFHVQYENERRTGGPGYRETVTTQCVLSSWNGEHDDFQARRARCAEMLEAIKARIDPLRGGDKTLGGACDNTRLGPDESWVQQAETQGCAVYVGFTIITRKTI